MKCIYCGCTESKVLDSRNSDESNAIRRRRECLNCGRRFTTYETIEMIPCIVIKNDGSRQPFDLNKIKTSILIACKKRPISAEQIDNMTREIEKKTQSMPNQEITSKRIGQFVMENLKNLDDVAFIRYSSIYNNFENIEDFKNTINNM